MGSGPQRSGVCENRPQEPSGGTTPSRSWGCRGRPSLLGTGQIKQSPPRPPPRGAWACLGGVSRACGSLCPRSPALRARGTEARDSEGTMRGGPTLGPSLPEGFHRTCGGPGPAGAGGQRVCSGSVHLPSCHTPVVRQATASREVRPGPGQHPHGPRRSLGLHDSPTSALGRRGRTKALGRSLPPALNGLAAWSKADMNIRVTCQTPHRRQPGIPQRGSPGRLQAVPTSHMSAKEQPMVTCRPTVTCRKPAPRAPRRSSGSSSPDSNCRLCISPQKWGLGLGGGSGHPSLWVCKYALCLLLLY